MLKNRHKYIIFFFLLCMLLTLAIQWYRRSKFRYFLSLQTNNWSKVIFLINQGIDPTLEDKNGYNAMYWAVYNAPIETMRELVQLGVPYETTGSSGKNPILMAAHEKRWDIVAWLLGLQDLSNRSDIGQQLLLMATEQGQLDMVSLFIQMGISPNFYSKSGFTPLHVALISPSVLEDRELLYKVVQLLVENGADICALSEPCMSTSDSYIGYRKQSIEEPTNPVTPIDLARELNDEKLLSLFKKMTVL